MENTPLNKAHEAGRRASKLIRKGLFEEAAECHLEAARLLHDLQQRLSDESTVLRSLDEQAKYHKRQAELAHIRRKALEKYTSRANSMETPKTVLVSGAGGGPSNSASSSSGSKRSGQKQSHVVLGRQSHPHPHHPSPMAHHEILKTFDEADSLLQILSERKFHPSAKDNKVSVPDTVSYHVKPVFTIRPKNDADVIEELQMVNSNLRNLVDRLLGELHEVREENKVLKKRLESYETTSSSSSVQSDMEKTSFVTSSLENYKPRELPELAPLETPEFDFAGFT